MPVPQLLLDQLPVELIFNVFNYFTATEIRHSFYDFSRYLRDCVRSYPHFNVQCQAIRKHDFDWICRTIRPNQITALTLSDDDETPGQLDLFFTRFPTFEQSFTRLEHLEIRNLDEFPHWPQLTSLHTLIVHFKHWPIYSFDYERVKQLDQNLANIFRLPALRNLTLNNESSNIDFSHRLLPVAEHLRQFKVYLQALDHLPAIFTHMPNVQRLSLCMRLRTLENDFISTMIAPQSLTHLTISITYGRRNEVRAILRACRTLTRLNIHIERQHTDVHQWLEYGWWQAVIDECLPELKIFRLKVELPLSSNVMLLHPMVEALRNAFRTNNERGDRSFSIRMIPLDEWANAPQRQTLSIDFPVNGSTVLPPHGFSNVQTLQLRYQRSNTDSYTVSDLSELQGYINDLSTLTHLKFDSTCALSPTLLTQLLTLAPRLTRLTIASQRRHLFPLLPFTYPQIRWLDMRREYLSSKVRSKFCSTFPCLQHLLNCYVCSEEDLEVLVEELPYLQSITIRIESNYFDSNDEFGRWLREHTQLKDFTFTLVNERQIQLWIHNRRVPKLSKISTD